MTPEEEQYMSRLQEALEAKEQEVESVGRSYATMFNKETDSNLIKWQLDIGEELERIEHLLRKHIPTTDDNGNTVFKEAEENQLFNEKGVQEILNLLAWYLNKNIILSNFQEDEVKLRMKQFGRTLTRFIFYNYENFGLDTDEKRRHFPMVVMNIVNTVEAAYHRALYGGERTSLRTARTVHQTENPAGFMSPPPTTSKKFNILKPNTWTT